MEKLSRATGARIVSSLDDLASKDLGEAGLVEERTVAGEKMVFVENCQSAKSVTIFVRASTEHVVAEAERAIVDAIGAVSAAVEEGHYVYGGGSVEMELAARLGEYAKKVGGREQLAIQAFADALEFIPRTLAENSGMDAIDTLVALRAKHGSAGNVSWGIDVFEAKIADVKATGVLEPAKVKRQAIASASEAARMILRIDDMISSKSKSSSSGGPGGAGGPSSSGGFGED
jgi:chaperonin GroEL (HSP60 family)